MLCVNLISGGVTMMRVFDLNRAPILFFTLLLGPFGFLLYLIVGVVVGRYSGDDHQGESVLGQRGVVTMNTALRYSRIQSSRVMKELLDPNKVLYIVAVAHFVLFLGMLALAPFDSRTVLGINPWIKPMKFALSIALFTASMAWLLSELPSSERSKAVVSWGIAVAMIVEMALIALQAARGVPSHFNNSSPFNGIVFGVMGVMITLNTALVGYVAYQFYRMRPPLPAAHLWGIRLGLTIFILASLEGFAMVGRMSHAVGVADGGSGLPFVNWSTEGGDLRIAHFIGMHALQVLPLVGYLLSQPTVAPRMARPVTWFWVVALGYGVVALLLFLYALAGQPLIWL
jgi:hypothetical protein